MRKRALTVVMLAVLLAVSVAMEWEARRRELLADKQDARLLRIQNDQAELQGTRLQLRAARREEELRLSLGPWRDQQRQFLASLKGLSWTALEWEQAGYYLESPERGRAAGHWK